MVLPGPPTRFSARCPGRYSSSYWEYTSAASTGLSRFWKKFRLTAGRGIQTLSKGLRFYREGGSSVIIGIEPEMGRSLKGREVLPEAVGYLRSSRQFFSYRLFQELDVEQVKGLGHQLRRCSR